MTKIDEIRKIQKYIELLESDYNIYCSDNFESIIHEYDSDEYTDEDIEEIYKYIEQIDINFPSEIDSISFPINDFVRYMEEITTLREIDKSTVRTTHIRQTVIDATRHGWCAFDEKLTSFVFKGDGYNVSVLSNPFLIGVINSKNGNYDEDYGAYPCSRYFALELLYDNDVFLTEKEEDQLFARIIYYLSKTIGSAVYQSEVIDLYSIVDDLDEDNPNAIEEIIDVKTLVKATPLTRLYSQALQADDQEIRFLYFYKIIEHISPMVAKRNAYEKLNKRLDLLTICERDYKYLESVFAICRKYDNDVKDDYLCNSVIETCVDVVPLWDMLPDSKAKLYNSNLKLNTKESITDASFNEEQLRSFQKQLASSLYATRNSIVHAKSNYISNGIEFEKSEMEEANRIMECISASIIQWNERQPEIYKIKED